MSYHAFSLDPRTVLGVGPGASPDAIREAYHAKSKKHHPDVGGDEWAFRMVARAYEVLKATTTAHSAQAWEHRRPGGSPPPEEQRWTWTRNAPFRRADSSHSGWESPGEPAEDGLDPCSDENAEEDSSSTSQEVGKSRAKPDELRSVNVELVWTRYERDSTVRFSSSRESEDSTLSVWMVISWPPHSLVDRAAEFPSSGETLHTLIELFGQLRTKGSVIATRSRIEDGRFVAWLSYSDVPAAGDAFLSLREMLQNRGLVPELRTRDILIPLDHHDAAQETVTAQAS